MTDGHVVHSPLHAGSPGERERQWRLHPSSLLFDAIQILPRLVLPLVALLPAALRTGDILIVAGPLLAITAVFAIIALIRYLRFSWTYEEADLVVRSGVLTRNIRTIPYARIQNLDASQNLLQRLFDVTVVHVQTGSGAAAEATFRVIRVSVLDEMRRRISAANAGVPAKARVPANVRDTAREHGPAPISVDAAIAESAAEHASGTGDVVDDVNSPPQVLAAPPQVASTQQGELLLALQPQELLLAGFIENRGIILIAGVFALLQESGALETWLIDAVREASPEFATRMAQAMGAGQLSLFQTAAMLLATILLLVLFVRLLSTVWALVRLYDFRLTRHGRELRTEYGLFTRVHATIPLHRIQTIMIRERMIHQWLGRCTVHVETAGGADAEGRSMAREPIAPLLGQSRLPELLRALDPDLNLDTTQWQPVHPRAFTRMLRRAVLIASILSLATLAATSAPWAGAMFAAVFGVYVAGARRRVRVLGWAETEDALRVRDGAWTRTVRITRYNRIQAVSVRQSPLDVRMGMGKLRADTAGAAGGGTVVPFLPQDVAEAVLMRLAGRAASTRFTW